MVLSAADLVLPFAEMGNLRPRGGGPMLAGAVAGAGVRTTGAGAVSAALSLAPKSLAASTIMMAVTHSDGSGWKDMSRLGGKTKGGLNRASKKYRQKYPRDKPNDHHLVPQQLLNDRRFVDRMKELGVEDVKAWVDKQVARIPAAEHSRLHSAGWNKDWKAWLGANPKFSLADVQAQIKVMMRKYKIPKYSRDAKKYGRN